IVEGVVVVEVAGERLAAERRAQRHGRRGRLCRWNARQRTDFQGDFGRAGEMPEQFAYADQVARTDLVADEGVGRIQHGGIVAPGRLQRFQPGMDVFGREFGFKAFETSGPGVHRIGSAKNILRKHWGKRRAASCAASRRTTGHGNEGAGRLPPRPDRRITVAVASRANARWADPAGQRGPDLTVYFMAKYNHRSFPTL